MALNIKDFSEDQEVNSDMIKQLVSCCERVEIADEYIANVEEKLQTAKNRRTHLLEREIPEIMDGIHIKTLTLSNGKKVSLKDIIAASIPKDSKDQALKWLEDNKHGDIIKTNLQIKFNREEHGKAKELAKNLMEDQYAVSISSDVHSQTFKSFVKEQIEIGSELPKGLFSVYLSRKAVIK